MGKTKKMHKRKPGKASVSHRTSNLYWTECGNLIDGELCSDELPETNCCGNCIRVFKPKKQKNKENNIQPML